MMLLAYLGLFSATRASMPEVSNRTRDAFSISMRWHMGSVRSTSRSNTACRSGGKSYLKRVNPEVSGTEEKPQKSLNSRENLRKMISRDRENKL